MALNLILPFATTDLGTNLMTDASYAADAQRITGHQPGTARSRLANKAQKQASAIAAGLAEMVAARQDTDISDSLSPSAFRTALEEALQDLFTQFLTASNVLRPGTMMMWPASSPPTGWLKRNGALLSRTTYANLFGVIGTTFGAGDGSTTFALPDDRGMFERGWDDGRGLDAGRVFGSFQTTMNASHTHSGTALSNGDHTHGVPDADQNAGFGGNFDSGGLTSIARYVTTTAAGAHTHALTIDLSGGVESRPYNNAYLPIIKF